MKYIFRLFTSIHVFIYRLSKGKFAGSVRGTPLLLLTTTGRKSGKKYTMPLGYFKDGNRFIVVASNGGLAANPGWYFNLKSHAHAAIEVEDRTIYVTSHEAEGEERARLWAELIKVAPAYKNYEKQTKRQIPVMILQGK